VIISLDIKETNRLEITAGSPEFDGSELPSATTKSCIGDRRSLHLQQIYSKLSPLG
jgi:hypothetical protein